MVRRRGVRFGLALFAAVAVAMLITPAAAQAAPRWSPPRYVYAPTEVQQQGYAYAPSTMITGGLDRMWTCHSRSAGQIRDDIFQTTRRGDTMIDSRSVLQAGSGWDSFHVCDPSVVRVDAVHADHRYRWAMFYLGNDRDCSCRNQVGVALADSPDGPWIRTGAPVVPFAGASTTEWGAGQPSAITLDVTGGVVLLAWTEGYASGTVARFGRVALGSGTPVLTGARDLPTAGLVDATGAPDWVNIVDLALASRQDRFYLVREGHPYPSGSSPDYISDRVQVASISAAGLWSGRGRWTVEGWIGAAITGRARTHNPGLVRTATGRLPEASRLSVRYTVADLDPGALWSYAVWQTTRTGIRNP